MIAEWNTNCVFLAAMLESRHPKLFQGLRQSLVDHGVEVRLLQNVRDVWAVDYCPVQVAEGTLVKFTYSPDYLRGHEHLITGDGVVGSFRDVGRCHRSNIVLDGGNVVTSGRTAFVTDKIYKENPGWERPQLRDKLQELLQVDQLLVIPREPFDPIGHADGQVRFLDEQTVLVNDYSTVDPAFGERLIRILRRYRLQVETLPYFHETRSREGIPSAVGNFVNFLRTEKVLVAPVYGTAQDEIALGKLESLFPSLPIVYLNCTDLAREGGVLRCISAAYHISPKKSAALTNSCHRPSPQ
ncbi:MAG TPA: agmatine deiminase family protein [Gemmataceae bacterium]|nr:agmatine deiminase family protein [Gemmataceae bacterium]